MRPFGALVFGRLGDMIGRKYTFLVTMMVMGVSTFPVGLLPTFATIGWLAPVLLVGLRLLQGLALGGEYGGAATYVAEHAPNGRRGYSTSWIQTTATIGFFLSLIVILICRNSLSTADFAAWGWRIPFIVSAFLLVFSIWIRLKLNESPVFQNMKSEGKASKSPLTRFVPALSQQQVCAARTAWRDHGPGRCLVYRPVLCPVLPHHLAEGGLPDSLHPDRHFAGHRYAVLHLLRLTCRTGSAASRSYLQVA